MGSPIQLNLINTRAGTTKLLLGSLFFTFYSLKEKSFPLSKILIGIVVAVVVLFAMLLVLKLVNQNSSNVQTPESGIELTSLIQVDVVDLNNDTQSYTVDDSNEILAYDLLAKLDIENEEFSIEYKQYDFGRMISKVNGVEPSSTQFWNIKVNGTDAQVGVDDLILNEGDVLTLSIVNF